MKYGLLFAFARTSGGSGWLSVAVPVRLWPMPSVTEVKPLAACCCTGRPGRWERVPAAYKRGLLYTDFWSACSEVLPAGQHRATGKGAGQTCRPNKASHRAFQWHFASAIGAVCAVHALVLEERYEVMASWTYEMHEICLRLFLHQYNRRIQIILNN